VVAALAVPFIVTAVYGIFEQVPTALPFIVVAVVGMAMLAQNRVRTIGIGFLVGTAVWGLALLYLFMSIGRGLAQFGS
jgi:hypothetical protein